MCVILEAENENNVNMELSSNNQPPLITSSPTLDGVVMRPDEDTEQLSPIQKSTGNLNNIMEDSVIALHVIDENDEVEEDVLDCMSKLTEFRTKRKRDSFDELSLASIDSLAPISSAKKPKLIRTGSITRGIRRSMSFVAKKTPIANMIKSRRSSVADPNISISSITSIETTFNDSIKRPVKETFKHLKDKLSKSVTPKSRKSSEYSNKFYNLRRKPRPEFNLSNLACTPESKAEPFVPNEECPFKTPVAPHRGFRTRFHSLVSSETTPRKISDEKLLNAETAETNPADLMEITEKADAKEEPQPVHDFLISLSQLVMPLPIQPSIHILKQTNTSKFVVQI